MFALTTRRLMASPRLVMVTPMMIVTRTAIRPILSIRASSVPVDQPPRHRIRTMPTTPSVSAIVPPIDA
jgi:hypothetical protein